MKELPMHFYANPEMAKMVMDRKDLKELLLESEGWIIACGRTYDIISKGIGAGVYRVWLEARHAGFK